MSRCAINYIIGDLFSHSCTRKTVILRFAQDDNKQFYT